MKFLNKNEATELYKTFGYTHNNLMERNLVLVEVDKLKLEEGIIILTEEWERKTPISESIKQCFKPKGKDFKTKKLRDESGWIIIRTK